uniref:C2H2-type domain-containing protein n=1 Tax=Timema monikensis TaxID=170555 RepID=A0A7R9HT53_9NEOP|nr:unnamed protein product [Timema monikensis]
MASSSVFTFQSSSWLRCSSASSIYSTYYQLVIESRDQGRSLSNEQSFKTDESSDNARPSTSDINRQREHIFDYAGGITNTDDSFAIIRETGRTYTRFITLGRDILVRFKPFIANAMTAHIEQMQTEFNEIITKLASLAVKQTPKVQRFSSKRGIVTRGSPIGESVKHVALWGKERRQTTKTCVSKVFVSICGGCEQYVPWKLCSLQKNMKSPNARTLKECSTKLLCSHCNGRHHKLLHLEGESANLEDGLQRSVKKNSASGSSTESQDSTPSLVALVESFFSLAPTGPWIVLMAVTTYIMSIRHRYEPVRVLLDCARQESLITSSCVQGLGLRLSKVNSVQLFGLRNTPLSTARAVAHCEFQPTKTLTLEVDALVVNSIAHSQQMPSQLSSWRHLSGLKLADEGVGSRPIDILLGAEWFPLFVTGWKVHGPPKTPSAIETIWGYCLLGKSRGVAKLLAELPQEHSAIPSEIFSFMSELESSTKILGFLWNPVHDQFSYQVQPTARQVTKRVILSMVARPYDPLGYLAAVIFVGKYLIHHLWQSGMEWDSPAPNPVSLSNCAIYLETVIHGPGISGGYHLLEEEGTSWWKEDNKIKEGSGERRVLTKTEKPCGNTQNEPDCNGTQLKLESTIEFVLNSILKPETNSNEPARDVCEEPGFKEELFFEEKSIDKNTSVVIMESHILKISTLNLNCLLKVNEDITKVIFMENVLNLRVILKHMSLFMVNTELTNVMFVARFSNTIKTFNLISSVIVKIDLTNVMFCGKCFKRNRELKSHLIRHGEHRPHKCDVCGKCFKEKDTLKTHFVTHSEHKPHKCDVCAKCFKEKDTLKSHFVSHSEHRPHKCDVCGKCFKLYKYLKSHLVGHSEHRPHKCDVCGKCFKLNKYLKSHLVGHSEHRPHKCDVCGKCFKRNSELKVHLISHGEDRPHKCDVCGKCFKRNRELKSHLIRHGEHRPHKCDVCGKCFKRKCELKSHIIRHG